MAILISRCRRIVTWWNREDEDVEKYEEAQKNG